MQKEFTRLFPYSLFCFSCLFFYVTSVKTTESDLILFFSKQPFKSRQTAIKNKLVNLKDCLRDKKNTGTKLCKALKNKEK